MPNGCERTVIAENGWQVALVEPAINDPATNFVYELTRNGGSGQISNIRICICPDISDVARTSLLQSCSYEVYYTEGDPFICEGPNMICCLIDNTIPNPNENPAACKGLKFDN